MKKLIYFALLSALIFIGCNKEEVVERPILSGKVIELEGDMPVVTAPGGSTRMLFEYADPYQDPASGAEIDFKWEVNDKVQLSFKQTINGTTTVISGGIEGTVTRIEQNGSRCVFTIPIPVGIDINQPYTIFGAAGGTPAGGAIFKTNSTVIETKQSVGDLRFNLTDLKQNAILVFKQEMPDGKNTRVSFKHIGAFLAFRVTNNSTKGENFVMTEALLESKSSPQKNWYYGGIVNYDVETGMASQVEKAVAKFVPETSPLIIAPTGSTDLLWQWVVPFTTPVSDLQLRVGTYTEDIKPVTFLPGNYYRIQRNWAGEFGGQYATRFCTNRQDTKNIWFKALFSAGAWVDVNLNNKLDEGVDINLTNGGNQLLTLPLQPRPYCYTIYGEVTHIDVAQTGNSNVIVSLTTNSPYLYVIEASNNNISKDALANLLLSLPDRTGLTPKGQINLYGNTPLISTFVDTHMITLNGVDYTYSEYAASKNWEILNVHPKIM